MKRGLLCVALTVGVFAATGGVAAAEVDLLDFGDHTNAAADGRFEVINANNQPANTGRRIVFSVQFQCTEGERIGIAYTVNQPSTEATGGGTLQRNCTGELQQALAVATANEGEPSFSDESPVDVEGAAATDVNTGLNDIDFADDQLDPFSPENPST
jgi:hypothetical protein